MYVVYGLFNLIQLASIFKTLQVINRHQSQYLGITYIVCSVCFQHYVKFFKGLSLNSTEFLHLSKHLPENMFSVSEMSNAGLCKLSYLHAKEAQQPKNIFSRLLSYSSRTPLFMLSVYRLKEYWWQSSKERLSHLLVREY